MSRLGDMSLRWRKEYLSRSLRRYRKGVDKMTLKSVLWDMKYTFLPQSYAWYQSLFPKDKFSGDIDPHYLFFDEKIIARIKEKHSDIKILLFLRNPVELYWSLFRMWAFRIRGLDTEQMNTDFVINRLQKTVGSSPSFCETITKWSKHFDNQHFYVAYYDDLVDDPYQFLRGITDFLGLNMSSISPADLTEVVHRGVHFDMPPEVELSVYEMLLPEVKKLCQIVESPHPNRWLKTMSERQLELH